LAGQSSFICFAEQTELAPGFAALGDLLMPLLTPDTAAGSRQPLLAVDGLRFGFGSRRVLDEVSFIVGAGELVTLVGPNGSGKTTLLKSLLGLLSPAAGTIKLAGHDIDSLSRREIARLIGYVPQDSSVRFPLTALEFVLQGRFAHGKVLGFDSERDVVEAQAAMEMTGTLELAGRPVTELSGGERQRVMVARALSGRPRLLLLDEPVANLDISHQIKTLDLVRRFTTDREISAIVVTHELNLASEFATAALMLKSGKVMANGPPHEVFTAPALSALFGADLLVDKNPVSGAPRITLVAPHWRPG
jgi:iron complex transport system ATP-binding protein